METTNFVDRVNTLDKQSSSLYNELAEIMGEIDKHMEKEGTPYDDYADVYDDMDAAFGALNRAVLKLKLRALVADTGYSPAAVG